MSAISQKKIHNNETEYVTTKQISKVWGVTELTVIKYCQRGLVKNAKYEKNWLIPKDSIKPIVKRGRKKKYNFTFIDLFCGIGGFHQAMSALGGQCKFACDINELCRIVYEKNYKNNNDNLIIGKDIKKAIKEDIIPEFDILCGGFPCQTFSKAGRRNGFDVIETEKGETDERGQLFFSIIDILKKHPECKYVVLENVRNLADKGNNWNIVCNELKNQGFIITEEPIIESPHKFGIPQVRERVYILGIREQYIKSEKLLQERKITRKMLNIEKYYKNCPKNCLTELLDENVESKYYVSENINEILEIWEVFLKNVKNVKSPFWLHKAGLGIYDDKEYKTNPEIGFFKMPEWKKELVLRTRKMYNNNHEFIDAWTKKYNMTSRSLLHQKFEWNASRDCKSIKDGITQIRQSGVRVKNPDFFPSLVAINNTPIVWDKYVEKFRYITPREAAKLQSFKEGFIFNESDPVSYRQLGNAVNVKLVKLFTESLLKL